MNQETNLIKTKVGLLQLAQQLIKKTIFLMLSWLTHLQE